jgi:hypothetical protein
MGSKTKAAMNKETLPKANATDSGSNGFIKALIVGGTFFAIVIISVVAKGPNDSWPSAVVIAIRIGLLSLFTLIYFLMLNHTQAKRPKDKGRQQIGKK